MIFAVVALTWAGCGNKAGGASVGDGSTDQEVFDVPDTLNNVEAVIKQVKAAYDYMNKENQLWLDTQFGTKEWQKTIAEVDKIEASGEEGDRFFINGFIPWTFDLQEGNVQVKNIKAEILENGMAEATFTLANEVDEDVDMHWLLKVEDGQWRVQTIFDGDDDMLANMRNWLDDRKFNATFDINGYLTDMQEHAQILYGDPDFQIHNYVLYDFDHDGTPEVIVSGEDTTWSMMAFSIADKDPKVLAFSEKTEFYIFEHGIGVIEGCGTGCESESYCFVKNSREDFSISAANYYDMRGELDTNESCRSKGDQQISDDEFEQLKKQLGAQVRTNFYWHDVAAD